MGEGGQGGDDGAGIIGHQHIQKTGKFRTAFDLGLQDLVRGSSAGVSACLSSEKAGPNFVKKRLRWRCPEPTGPLCRAKVGAGFTVTNPLNVGH